VADLAVSSVAVIRIWMSDSPQRQPFILHFHGRYWNGSDPPGCGKANPGHELIAVDSTGDWRGVSCKATFPFTVPPRIHWPKPQNSSWNSPKKTQGGIQISSGTANTICRLSMNSSSQTSIRHRTGSLSHTIENCHGSRPEPHFEEIQGCLHGTSFPASNVSKKSRKRIVSERLSTLSHRSQGVQTYSTPR